MAKIIIIGEKEVDLKFIKIILKSQGHEVYTNYCPEKAIEQMEEIMPDITIIDISYVDDYGFELCKLIRSENKFHHIPVILALNTQEADFMENGFECGASDYISKPVNEDEIKTRIDNCIYIIESHKKAQNKNQAFTSDMNNLLKTVQHPQMDTIIALAKLAQSRDDNTGKHLDRMQKYVYVLSKELQKKYPEKFTDKFVAEITAAAPLHDIGKIGIPDKILLKPGKLNEQEFEVIKTHTMLGDETLDNIIKTFGKSDFIEMGKQITRYHHERPDGNGYPDKITDIPIEAAIMAIADVYDALRTKKIYKPSISHEKTIDFIKEKRGIQFLPEVVDAFLNVEKTFAYIWLEYATMCGQ